MARNATTAKPSYLKLLRPELNLKRPNVSEVQSECRKAYYLYIDFMITSDETEPGNLKRFWSFINSKKCDNSGVAPLKIDGVAYSDFQVKANILNDQFSSVFTKEDTSTIQSLGHITHHDLVRITVSEEGVQKLLRCLKIHSAAGPDEIPARLLKEYASLLEACLGYTSLQKRGESSSIQLQAHIIDLHSMQIPWGYHP